MRNQNEIFTEIKEVIPADLWEKYNHLSFGEMAEVDELDEWADELRQAEKEWYVDELGDYGTKGADDITLEYSE